MGLVSARGPGSSRKACDDFSMGTALSRCVCLMSQQPCAECNGTGVCKACEGTGMVISKYEVEVFSYVLDKKGAYKDVKPEPKQCVNCGGWGGTAR